MAAVDPGRRRLASPARLGSSRRTFCQRLLDLDLKSLEGRFPALSSRIKQFARLPRAEKETRITDGLLRYGPYAMFVLLPAFAGLLKIVYLGRRRRYPDRPRLYSEHMVFAYAKSPKVGPWPIMKGRTERLASPVPL